MSWGWGGGEGWVLCGGGGGLGAVLEWEEIIKAGHATIPSRQCNHVSRP